MLSLILNWGVIEVIEGPSTRYMPYDNIDSEAIKRYPAHTIANDLILNNG